MEMANIETQNIHDGQLTSVMETFGEYETYEAEDILTRQSFRTKSRSLNDLYFTMDDGNIQQQETYTYDYLDIQKIHPVYVAGKDAEYVTGKDAKYVVGRVKSRPLPQIPVAVREDKPRQRETSERPEYITLLSGDAEHIFANNQSEHDFFQYTVVEVEHCFKHCGLSDFGSKCLEHRLDGHFFEHFDLQELKKEPFEMSDFQVLKVKKMIYEGWRPIMYK
jgi:hypothetical protein